MINVLRRFSQPIMVLVTIFIIVTFIWWSPSLYNRDFRNTEGPALYGKPLKNEVWQREQNKLQIYAALRGEYAQTLDPALRNGGISLTGVANSMVFEHEADAMGITATEQDLKEEFARIPVFRDRETGQFSQEQFDMIVERVLNPNGYNRDQLATFLTGEVRMRKMKAIIGGAVSATPAEVREVAVDRRLFTEASYVTFNRADFVKTQTATDEELKKRYEDRKEQLKTAEKRKVRFAAFIVPADPAPAAEPGKPVPPVKNSPARTALLQEAAKKAYDLRQALENNPKANFDELAKTAGATLGETKEFFALETPPAEIEAVPAIAQAAFALSKEKPYSKHLTAADGLKNGAYVLVLGEVKAPEQKPFETVKESLQAEIVNEKGDAAMRAKATETLAKLNEAKKAGKSFYEAAEALGLKPQPFPSFSASKPAPRGSAHETVVPAAAVKLAPGALSEVLPDGEDVLIVHVDQRPAVDEKGIELDYPRIEQQLNDGDFDFRDGQIVRIPGRHDIAFQAWLRDRSVAAGVDKLNGPAQ